jgi:hypothetical protein
LSVVTTMKPTVFALDQERVLVLGVGLREVGRHVADLVAVGPRRAHALLRLAHLRRGDHLHRLGDLLGVLHRLDLAAYFLAYGHGDDLRRAASRRANAPSGGSERM